MRFLVVLAVLVLGAEAQEDVNTVDVGTQLINTLFDSPLIQSKIAKLLQFVDLKIRFGKLVHTLLSRENLLVQREVLEFVVEVCNFVIGFLPEPAPPSAEENGVGFLQTLFPVVNLEDQRYTRRTNVTDEDLELLNQHKDDAIHVAKLIYNTP